MPQKWLDLGGAVQNLPEPQTLHEGDRHHLVREDGSEQDVEMKQSSASMSFHFDELDTATTEEIIKKWDAAARDMHGQMTKHLFQVVDEGCEEVGNVTAGAGRPFEETFLEAMEKVSWSFEADGAASRKCFYFHPSAETTIREALARMSSDPAFEAKYKAIEAKKKEEWRAREADRKLVG